jgi:benzoate/toluate 1,2-dioxygenase beta subunit
MISDPEVEINTMYIVGRAGLEARVFRMTSRDSYASLPLAWTSHVIGTIRLLGQNEAGDLTASAKWLVLSLDSRRGKMVRGGWYDYALADTPQGLRIRSKKITLLESMIDGTIDVFQV